MWLYWKGKLIQLLYWGPYLCLRSATRLCNKWIMPDPYLWAICSPLGWMTIQWLRFCVVGRNYRLRVRWRDFVKRKRAVLFRKRCQTVRSTCYWPRRTLRTGRHDKDGEMWVEKGVTFVWNRIFRRRISRINFVSFVIICLVIVYSVSKTMWNNSFFCEFFKLT